MTIFSSSQSFWHNTTNTLPSKFRYQFSTVVHILVINQRRTGPIYLSENYLVQQLFIVVVIIINYLFFCFVISIPFTFKFYSKIPFIIRYFISVHLVSAAVVHIGVIHIQHVCHIT